MSDIINIDDYLRINVYDAILVLISTLLIVFIVKKFFWNYVREYLDKRQAYIADQLSSSEQKLKESDELKKQYEDKLSHAKDEAQGIIQVAKDDASREAKEILVQAKESADLMKQKAEREIEQEKIQAKQQMKQEISDVAFLVAKQVVQKEVDEETHKQYVDDFIEQAGESSWQA